MEKISLWCKLLSVVSIVSGILFVLIPESKLKGAYKTFCCIVILYTCFSFSGSLSDIKNSEFYSENISENIEIKGEELMIKEGERLVNNKVEKILKENGIVAKCQSEIELEKEEVKISEIVIYGLFNETDKEAIKSMLKEIVNENTNIIFKEKEKEYGT